MQCLKADNLMELFELLDEDGSGQVDIEEFCDGITKLAVSEQPMEFVRIMKQVAIVRRESKSLRRDLGEMIGCLKQIMEDQSSSEKRMAERLNRLEQQISGTEE